MGQTPGAILDSNVKIVVKFMKLNMIQKPLLVDCVTVEVFYLEKSHYSVQIAEPTILDIV